MRTFLLILAFFIWTICKADNSVKVYKINISLVYYDLNGRIIPESKLKKHTVYIKCIYYDNSLTKSEKIIWN